MHSVRFNRSSVVVGCLSASVMLFAAVLTASADTIAYDIADYPAAEIDVNNSYQDSVSGTITASATGLIGSSYIAGSFNPATDPENVSISYNITLTTSDPSAPGNSYNYSGSGLLSAYLGSGTAEFTSAALLLNFGYLSLGAGGATYGEMYWRSDINSYFGEVKYPAAANPTIYFSQSPATTLDAAGQSQNDSSSTWTIATYAAPEPGAVTLLGTALAGLGLFSLPRLTRRRTG